MLELGGDGSPSVPLSWLPCIPFFALRFLRATLTPTAFTLRIRIHFPIQSTSFRKQYSCQVSQPYLQKELWIVNIFSYCKTARLRRRWDIVDYRWNLVLACKNPWKSLGQGEPEHPPRLEPEQNLFSPTPEPCPFQEGGIMVHVAASQVTSSNVCRAVKPMFDRLSKFPSPSTCTILSELCHGWTVSGPWRDLHNRAPPHSRSASSSGGSQAVSTLA
jgi:hypothetical protein